MKKRTMMAIIATALVIFVFAVMNAGSQDNVRSVQDSAFKKIMRPTVPFFHDEHNESAGIEECNVCHHVFEDGEIMEDESSEDSECSECHAPEGNGYPMSLVMAYHTRCKGCHEEQESGPIMCSECHVR